jgi:hypothetical protein
LSISVVLDVVVVVVVLDSTDIDEISDEIDVKS